MENETIWRAWVQHDSEHNVALRGGPTGFIGGADIKEQKLSERLAREAEIVRRTKITAALVALRRYATKVEYAPILAALYELGLTPRERRPVIRALLAQGFTQSEIIAALWHMETEEDPGYESASMEYQRALS